MKILTEKDQLRIKLEEVDKSIEYSRDSITSPRLAKVAILTTNIDAENQC